jgi:hypothetical protein
VNGTSIPASEKEAGDFLPCPCEDYRHGIRALNTIVIQAASRGHHYTGPIFRYCPFCAKPLIQKRRSA